MTGISKNIGLPNLFKDNLSIFLLMLISYFATLALNYFLAEHLSPESYGDISVILRLLYFFIPFILLGTEEAALFFLPQYESKKDWSKFKGFLAWNKKIFLFSLSFTNALNVLALGLIVIAITHHYFGIKDWHDIHPFFYSIWILPLFGYIYLQATFLQAFKKYSLSVILLDIGFPLVFMAILFGFLLFFKKLNNIQIVLSLGAACVLLICLQAIFKIGAPEYKVEPQPTQQLSTAWWAKSIALFKGNIIFFGIATIEIIMLEVLGNKEGEVGMLAAISVIAEFLSLFSDGVAVIVTPLINTYADNLKKLQPILNLCNTLKLIPSVIAYLVILFYGKTILGYFGDIYTQAYIPLLIVTTFDLINSCMSFASTILFYTEHLPLYVKITKFQLLASLILYFVLIPKYQLIGALVATGVSSLAAKAIFTYYTRQKTGLKAFYFV